MTETNVTMKLLINSQTKKVLFAEAGKECVDFLFYMLSLPIATVITLLREQGMVGCLSNLYESMENLNDSYIQTGQTKSELLKVMAKPPSFGGSAVPLLRIANTPNPHEKDCYYVCSNRNCSTRGCSDGTGAICSCGHSISERTKYFPSASGNTYYYVCSDWIYCGTRGCSNGIGAICSCGNSINQRAKYFPAAGNQGQASSSGSGFVKGVVTYMVMDDLVVNPMSTISSLTLLNKYSVKDVGALQEKVVNVGMEEALKILKTSLSSKNVLTAVFLNKTN